MLKWVITSSMSFQGPIPDSLFGTGLLYLVTSLYASSRSSIALLISAQRGARGNAATKNVTKPYCTTKTTYIKNVHTVSFCSTHFHKLRSQKVPSSWVQLKLFLPWRWPNLTSRFFRELLRYLTKHNRNDCNKTRSYLRYYQRQDIPRHWF